MDKTVLAYIFKDNQVLMLFRNKKENDINKGKWMGVGGHIEKGETPDQALIREIKEETNLNVISYELRGKLLFINHDYKELIYLYIVNKVEGDLITCNEGDLSYIDVDKLMNLNMWEGDYYFLKLLLDNKPYFELTLTYDGDELMSINQSID